MNKNKLALLCATTCAASACVAATDDSSGVVLKQLDDRVRVEINGQLFTEYYFKDVTKPYCYPIIGPTGAGMTRDWPMKNTPGEEHDHLHHTGLWFGHQKVNGYNFWSAGPTLGKVIQESLTTTNTGKDSAAITTVNRWVATNGTVVLRDERTLRFYNRTNDRILDFEITLKATEGNVTFGDDKDGIMGIRIPESMRVLKPTPKGDPAKPSDGHIVLSSGVQDNGATAAAAKDAKREAQTWGRRAQWCDYYGPVDGKTVGIAMFDHPDNPRHPTWWHVRDYGLMAANPFGEHFFENLKDGNAGNYILRSGLTTTFRYRFYFHEGDAAQADVAGHYKEYVRSAANPVKQADAP